MLYKASGSSHLKFGSFCWLCNQLIMNASIGFTIFNTFNVLVKLCVDKFVHLICINLAVLLINIVQLRDICSHRVYVSTPIGLLCTWWDHVCVWFQSQTRMLLEIWNCSVSWTYGVLGPSKTWCWCIRVPLLCKSYPALQPRWPATFFHFLYKVRRVKNNIKVCNW